VRGTLAILPSPERVSVDGRAVFALGLGCLAAMLSVLWPQLCEAGVFQCGR
jgi:hypothetical protein